MIEYVISKTNFSGSAEAILKNGVGIYSKKTKADYLAAGFAVVDQHGLTEAFNAFADRICGMWVEITEEQYEYALNVLPPEQWFNGGFFISERLVGDVSAFYQQYKTRYFKSNQRINTPREIIMASLKAFEEEHKDTAYTTILTTKNAPYVAVIRNIENPDWGTKRFNYNSQPLNGGQFISTFGVGCNSALLSNNEFSFWEVIRWK